jgi:putative transposase
MRGNLEVYRAFFILLTYMLKPRYDTKLQLMAYQVTMLRDRIDDSRIMPTDRERAELLRLGADIDHDISDVMLVVKPATYRGWRRKQETDRKKRGAGRPGTPQATINLVMRMATENLGWGYSKILGELKKLGIRIGRTTIQDILKREGHYPVPDKAKKNSSGNWKQFISSHMDTLVACDFFSKPVLTWRGRVDAYVLVFIHIGSRKVFMSFPTFHPHDDWVLQQARNATIWLDDIGVKATGLIRDRDTKFTTRFDAIWKGEGAKVHKTPVRAPMANSYSESYIGKLKQGCLNHFICFSLDHLDYINREWLKYYHNQRPHQGIDINNNVLDVNFRPTDQGDVKREQRLGGVISWYYRDAA